MNGGPALLASFAHEVHLARRARAARDGRPDGDSEPARVVAQLSRSVYSVCCIVGLAWTRQQQPARTRHPARKRFAAKSTALHI